MGMTRGVLRKLVFWAFLFLLAAGTDTALVRQGDGEGIRLEFLSEISEPAWADGAKGDICVHAGRLFIPLGYPGLAAYDISLPSAPLRLFSLHSTDLGGQAGAVAAYGDRVYAALPLQESIHWGYHIPFMLMGMLDRHPRDAMKWMAGGEKDDFVKFYEQITYEG